MGKPKGTPPFTRIRKGGHLLIHIHLGVSFLKALLKSGCVSHLTSRAAPLLLRCLLEMLVPTSTSRCDLSSLCILLLDNASAHFFLVLFRYDNMLRPVLADAIIMMCYYHCSLLASLLSISSSFILSSHTNKHTLLVTRSHSLSNSHSNLHSDSLSLSLKSNCALTSMTLPLTAHKYAATHQAAPLSKGLGNNKGQTVGFHTSETQFKVPL